MHAFAASRTLSVAPLSLRICLMPATTTAIAPSVKSARVTCITVRRCSACTYRLSLVLSLAPAATQAMAAALTASNARVTSTMVTGTVFVATLAAFLSPVATSACCGIRFATTAAASAAAPAAATADCNVAGAATDSDSNVAATRAADAGGAAAGGAACPATGPTAAAAAVTSFSTTIAMATASFSATATATAAAAAATAFVVAVADAAVSVAAAATSPAASSTMAPPSAIRTSADPTHAAFSFTTPSGKATKLAGCSITLAAASTATAVTTVFFNPPKLSATVFAPL
mmetsp:Transcript_30456/g.76253  ORF Transcript_30456/g.76253 Transcript_30456/m.76253 type:complete len:288 (+) Transcript_30456:739-1602(+)